jgi:L-asparaginase / beta-aspartyl-peptidase
MCENRPNYSEPTERVSREKSSAEKSPFAIAIHGGAGLIHRSHMTAEREAAHRAGLAAALDAGYEVLKRGGTSLDAVTTSVRILEDDPLFNAGRGSVLTHDGKVELDASIMDGSSLRAGSVAGVRHIVNPIELARLVMEKSRHVMLIGDGAEEFALEQGLVLVPNSYFITLHREQELKRALQRERDAVAGVSSAPVIADAAGSIGPTAPTDAAGTIGPTAPTDATEGTTGTVGAVALDRAGNLAAATSTGGMINKRYGRVGDSPIIGAGTYANNESCAVSSTGAGEFFIRLAVAHDLHALVHYKHLSLQAAAREVLDKVRRLGADGGVIAVDRFGHIAMEFNTKGMFRGARNSSGLEIVALYADSTP